MGRSPEPSTQHGGDPATRDPERGPAAALASVLERSPAWRRLGPEAIAGELADVLGGWPELDAALVRHSSGEGAVDWNRPSAAAAGRIAPLLDELPGPAVTVGPGEDDPGAPTLRAVRIPTGGELGVVVASCRPDFPSPRELLMLRSACAQADLAMEAARLRGRLEEADARRDEFLSSFGHELRDHLAPILTSVALLKMEEGRPVVDHERQRQIIGRQSTQLAHLVNDLLDLSHLARGRVRIKREPLEIDSVVSGALELAAPLLGEPPVRIATEVEAGLCVEADRARLIQVLAILLGRAARVTGPGESIELVARRAGDWAEVAVRDEGGEIQTDRVPHVFDPFAPPPRSGDQRRGGFGVGLGLALARGLVVLHGGSVSVTSSARGAGTEFLVRLPLMAEARRGAEEPAVASERRVRAPTVPGPDVMAGLQVLVVDDNIDQADSLAMFIEASGMVAQVAYSPMQALHLAEKQRFAVAVLDIGLPGMDGYELARRLRRTRHGSEMRMFALTGFGDDGDVARSRRAGFRRHFVKPIDGATLLAAIVQDALRGPRGQA